jgi:hypothetical protein
MNIGYLTSCLTIDPEGSWKENEMEKCIPVISSGLCTQSGFLMILSLRMHSFVERFCSVSSRERSFPFSFSPVRTLCTATLDHHTS